MSIDDNQQSPSKQQNQNETNKSTIENRNFTTCLRYSGMIFLDFLGDNELVVVEQPWLGIVNSLPDALERQRYGS